MDHIEELNLRIKPNTYIVLDIKQGIVNPIGTYIPGNEITYDNAIVGLHRALASEITGCKRRSRIKPLHNLTTLENAHGGRWHVNIVLRRPEDMPLGEFERIFRSVWYKSRWSYGHPYIADMTGNAVGYSLKEGLGTILPRSSSF